jgi:hypothetical protein
MQEILIGAHKKNQADFLELFCASLSPDIFGSKVIVSACLTRTHEPPEYNRAASKHRSSARTKSP